MCIHIYTSYIQASIPVHTHTYTHTHTYIHTYGLYHGPCERFSNLRLLRMCTRTRSSLSVTAEQYLSAYSSQYDADKPAICGKANNSNTSR